MTLYCAHCLRKGKRVEAVMTYSGTSLCEQCWREIARGISEMIECLEKKEREERERKREERLIYGG